ncbi:hypothetical protein AgCh_000686 [Apium graveolens]
MERIEESTEGDMVIPSYYGPKDPSKYTYIEKEKVSLDSDLQLILIESLDNVIYNNIVNCDTSKQIWEKIEILVKLINNLQLHDKYYEAEEVNLKFLLTLPDHLEQKISAIREGRDLSRMTLEVLYGILKTYELEMIQRKSLRASQEHIVNGSSALFVNNSQSFDDELEIQTLVALINEQKNKEPQKQVILELEEDELYTLDELDELDQSKIRCFNCDELGHFAIECRKPKKVKNDKAYLELEAKYEALLRKQQGKAYIAEGKSWDDSDNDDDEEVGNYTLMALDQGESSSSKNTASTEEVSRLSKANEKLENEK